MPLPPIASMVGEDELQERWAVLMESIVTGNSCLPSFGQTLSQLTTEEVQYLDRLWKIVSKPTHYVSAYRFGREPMEYYTLLKVFDPDVNPGVNSAERKIFSDLFSDEQKANYERLGHAGLVIEDLIRLGIIVTSQITEQTFPPHTHAARCPGRAKCFITNIRFRNTVSRLCKLLRRKLML